MATATILEQKDGLTLLEAKFGDGKSGNGSLSGYASVKNNIDAYGDVILDGAYKNLEVLKRSGWSGFNHSSEPVGIVTEAYEDSKGLYVNIEFHSTAYAQDVRKIAQERKEAGMDLGMSIMFRTIESGMGERDEREVRELKAIEVVEAGFVMLPANKAATVTSVKSGHGVPLDEQVESLLVGIEDAKSRLEKFKAERKQGLSETNIKRVEALRDGLSGLLDDPKVEPIDEETLKGLQPTW